jgi:hypothetical protein
LRATCLSRAWRHPALYLWNSSDQCAWCRLFRCGLTDS